MLLKENKLNASKISVSVQNFLANDASYNALCIRNRYHKNII